MRTVNVIPNFGKHCFVRPFENKMIKVFHAYPISPDASLKDFLWGDPPKKGHPNMSVLLTEATKIQNICWLHGLAPRVYEIAKVVIGQNTFFAQIIEDIGENYAKDNGEAESIYFKVKELGKEYGFINEKDDVSMFDVIDGKLIDFNTFHFTNDHLDKIKAKYCQFGMYGEVYYQDVPEFNLNESPRKSEFRVSYMALDQVDFIGRTVLDIGCAGGFFCRYAKSRDAKRVFGIDYNDVKDSNPVKAAYLISNELENWDIEYLHRDITSFDTSDINELEHDISPHIVFFCSMNYHVGIPKWLSEITKELCIFEDNSKERNAKEQLEKEFTKVEFVGHAGDHGNKPIYHCWK